MKNYICGYIVSAGHTRFLLDDNKLVLEISATNAREAFIYFKKIVDTNNKKSIPTSEFHSFYSVSATPKEYEDAHGWRGSISYPR
jgi:hypothetical protein